MTKLDVSQPVDAVWAFSTDPMAQKKWDRSVADVEVTSQSPFGAGSTFKTIGPARGGRSGIVTCYRVTEFEPVRHATVEVIVRRRCAARSGTSTSRRTEPALALSGTSS
jgi:hypothetical protein